jgi:hypothetical protein
LKTLLTICLAAAVALTACHVALQPLAVPISYAPKLNFGRDSTTILLVSRFDFESRKLHSKAKLAVLNGAAYTAVATAANELNFLPKVKAINLVDSVNFGANPDSVNMLAQQYKAQYVLTLDRFYADIDSDVDFNGSDKVSVYSSVVNANFTLYEADGLHFKRLSGKASDFHSDAPYQGILGSLIMQPSIKKNAYALNRSARNATLNALKEYLPSTITNYRRLYMDNDSLKKAVNHIYAKQYKEAFDILNPIIDGEDMKLASHAAYDLAVVYEAQGDIKTALETARLSNQKQQNDYATLLIPALEKE